MAASCLLKLYPAALFFSSFPSFPLSPFLNKENEAFTRLMPPQWLQIRYLVPVAGYEFRIDRQSPYTKLMFDESR